jgi:hypothetical protein
VTLELDTARGSKHSARALPCEAAMRISSALRHMKPATSSGKECAPKSKPRLLVIALRAGAVSADFNSAGMSPAGPYAPKISQLVAVATPHFVA